MSIEGLKDITGILTAWRRQFDDTADTVTIDYAKMSDDASRNIIETVSLCLETKELLCDTPIKTADRSHYIS